MKRYTCDLAPAGKALCSNEPFAYMMESESGHYYLATDIDPVIERYRKALLNVKPLAEGELICFANIPPETNIQEMLMDAWQEAINQIDAALQEQKE